MHSSTVISFLFAAFIATASASVNHHNPLRSEFQKQGLAVRDRAGYEDCCVDCVNNGNINNDPDALDNCFSECWASNMESDGESCDDVSGYSDFKYFFLANTYKYALIGE
jgi:hypothetical protein